MKTNNPPSPKLPRWLVAACESGGFSPDVFWHRLDTIMRDNMARKLKRIRHRVDRPANLKARRAGYRIKFV